MIENYNISRKQQKPDKAVITSIRQISRKALERIVQGCNSLPPHTKTATGTC